MALQAGPLPRRRHDRQCGTSLLEVLISMVLLTVGLLAMAGLSASSARYNKLSQIRGTAAMLVNDYAERARTNRAGFDAGGYANNSTYVFTKTLNTLSGCSDAVSSPCTAASLAAYDQNEWQNLLRRRLPGGDAYIITSLTALTQQRDMDIWIMWTEKQLDTGLNLSQSNCPSGASAGSDVKCMYFKVSL